MLNIIEYPSYRYEFSMAQLLGVVFCDNSIEPYLINPYLFTAFLALYLKNYDIAKKYMYIYNSYSRLSKIKNEIDMFIIDSMKNGIKESEVQKYISPFASEEMIDHEIRELFQIQQNGMIMPKCPDCSLCEFNLKCSYNKYISIKNNLESASNRLQREFEDFIIKIKR